MTKEQVIASIKEAAERRGFTTDTYQFTHLVEIKERETHYLNFTITERTAPDTERTAPDTDWTQREVTEELHFRASLASMGGQPTPEELLKASEIIRAGAELVMELEGMGLSYTETY